MADAVSRSVKKWMVAAQTRDWVGSLRPVDIFLNYRYISFPTSAVNAASRLEQNSVYFLSNYGFVLLVTYFYAVVFQPVLFFSFCFTLAAFFCLEFFKANTYNVGPYAVTHTVRLIMLTILTIIIVAVTAGMKVTIITLITCACLFVHCILHSGATNQYEKLPQDDLDVDMEAGQLSSGRNMSHLQAPIDQIPPHAARGFSASNTASPAAKVAPTPAPVSKPSSIYDAYAASLAAASSTSTSTVGSPNNAQPIQNNPGMASTNSNTESYLM